MQSLLMSTAFQVRVQHLFIVPLLLCKSSRHAPQSTLYADDLPSVVPVLWHYLCPPISRRSSLMADDIMAGLGLVHCTFYCSGPFFKTAPGEGVELVFAWCQVPQGFVTCHPSCVVQE